MSTRSTFFWLCWLALRATVPKPLKLPHQSTSSFTTTTAHCSLHPLAKPTSVSLQKRPHWSTASPTTFKSWRTFRDVTAAQPMTQENATSSQARGREKKSNRSRSLRYSLYTGFTETDSRSFSRTTRKRFSSRRATAQWFGLSKAHRGGQAGSFMQENGAQSTGDMTKHRCLALSRTIRPSSSVQPTQSGSRFLSSAATSCPCCPEWL